MALAEELVLEADAWERGERNASAISVSWTREFHAKNVARRALEYLDLVNSQPQQTEVDQIVNRSL